VNLGRVRRKNTIAEPRRSLRDFPFTEASFTRLFPSLSLSHTQSDSIEHYPDQVRYFWHYLHELTCSHFVQESYYYDRDFLEDFGAIYSRSTAQIRNHCVRIHFFAQARNRLQLTGSKSHLKELRKRIQEADPKLREKLYFEASAEIQNSYLGFMVLRPLPLAPIGRTVLRAYSRRDLHGEQDRRDVLLLRSSVEYRVHYAGFRLIARGVAFQQQDRGSAACATTAIWSVLNSLGLRNIPPVEITRLANRYGSSPMGRTLPSEGLVLRQMIEAFRGVSLECFPHMHEDISTTLAYLHLAVRSRLPAVAIVTSDRHTESHAVAILGGRERIDGQVAFKLRPDTRTRAGRLTSVYIHDDRLGPYVRADLHSDGDRLGLRLRRRWRVEDEELWITDLIFPLFPEIRTSLPWLLETSKRIVPHVRWWLRHVYPTGRRRRDTLTYDIRIVRGADYPKQLLIEDGCSHDVVRMTCDYLTLSRFVAVTRLYLREAPIVDVVQDTTGTTMHRRDPVVVPVGADRAACIEMALFIREWVLTGKLERTRRDLEAAS